MPENIQKILRELKAGLRQIYGEQLDSVILYGSYARGDAHPPDSDIDVMIVLKGDFDPWAMEKKSADLVTDLCLKYDVLISWQFSTIRDYQLSRIPFMINIRREGVAL